METYVRKSATVQARENTTQKQVVVSSRKGQQTAQVGDFLVQDDAALAVLRQREIDEQQPVGSIPNKGTVYVVSKADFLADYELAPIDDPESVEAVSDDAPADPPVEPPATPSLDPALVTA